jgi:hypothetical protein
LTAERTTKTDSTCLRIDQTVIQTDPQAENSQFCSSLLG